ncbi:MAG: hypothetical protein IJT69_02275 [Clostridia bacterium]|nr:hypothetical protein [Clostridia bacterium]
MGNRDINLFKAAGGERAKGAKRSPVTYMMLVTLVVIIAAIGVLVFFNMRANAAEKSYKSKRNIITNYENTIMNVQAADEGSISLADEYRTVRNDIDAAAAIGTYIDSVSTMFPKASESEIEAVKNFLLAYGTYSFNDPVEDEEFEPWDIEGLRESLYAEDASSFEGRELFYYALQRLAAEQEEQYDTNVWYTYYRNYMLIVFTGGEGNGLDSLCDAMITAGQPMGGFAPFSRVEMANDTFTSGYYAPAKFFWKVYETSDTEAITFNCLLMPVKSIIERMFDILEAHSRSLTEENEFAEEQIELVAYGVSDLIYSADQLHFNLILPDKDLFTGYVESLDASRYFSVSNSVYRSNGEPEGAYTSWPIVLDFEGFDLARDDEEE